jgi:hypothetical protein
MDGESMVRTLLALLCLVCMPVFAQSPADRPPGDLADFRAAEEVARSFVELSLAGKYRDAVKLVDPDTLVTSKAAMLDLIERARAGGQAADLAAMGITAPRAQLERLAPPDFFVEVIARMKPLPAGASVSVLNASRLPDGRCAVTLSLSVPGAAPPGEATAKLKRVDGRWMVQLGV